MNNKISKLNFIFAELNLKFPFKAQIENDLIYARGALDNKAQMLSMLEAMRIFLRNHGQPQHSVYLAFGHNIGVWLERFAWCHRDSQVFK